VFIWLIFDKGVMQLMSQVMDGLSDRKPWSVLDRDIIQPYLVDGWEIDRLEERQFTFLFW
jgi:hypothetical protein